MFLCEILTEQQQALPQQEEPSSDDELRSDELENDGEEGGDVQVPNVFEEILPLKRYYLIQKLHDLKTKLGQYNITNENLDIVIRFINSFSYNALLILATALISDIESKLERVSDNAQR
jgi:hypothetical protein